MTEQLAVYSDQRRLGSITFDGHDDKYSLLYDPEWLEKSGFSISPHLKPEACKSESIKRFLANLLPSTTLYRNLGRNAKIVCGRCPG
jgi:HipA-like protein